MIQQYSLLKVCDNTGATEIEVIQVVEGGKKKAAHLGNVVVGAVKKATAQGQVKKKNVVRAVIVRQRAPFQRPDGTTLRFDDNAVVLINPDHTPRGTRIFGPVSRELRGKFPKIISQAPEVV